MPLLCTLLLTGLLHPRAVYAHTTATHLYIPHIARRSSTVIQTAFVRSPASPFRTQAVNRFSHSRLITTIPRMAAPADDGFTGRPWKGGEAHEVLPKVFLGSMVSATTSILLNGGCVLRYATPNPVLAEVAQLLSKASAVCIFGVLDDLLISVTYVRRPLTSSVHVQRDFMRCTWKKPYPLERHRWLGTP